jgi:acyl-coenzyme A synthetase/AMP-(fatty) acid ligase/acyl carrier protein
VVLASPEVAADGNKLLETLDTAGITIMQATPVTWRLLLTAGWNRTQPLKVFCGGEALPQDLAVELLEHTETVWNLYGPTETTIWSTCYELSDPEAPVLIGRPIANTQAYVLDRHRQPVPIGVAGELYIGGVGVTRGYLKRPELTAERFVSSPFSGDPEARLYKTGDLVRYRPDGNLEYLNRLDSQVKVRGFRIELGEIEAVLTKHAAVRQAVVNVREDRPGDQRVIAYIVPAPDHMVTATELRQHLRTQLPEYMIPQHVVELDALPVTPNNKIDRQLLPAPFSIGAPPEETYVAPRTETEKLLAKIWQEALGVEHVGIHDNFFDLGGHSLLSMQVIARIKRQTGIHMSPLTIVMNSIAQIALPLEGEYQGGGGIGAPLKIKK